MAVPMENATIHNVLFASDLSDNSRQAFRYAAGIGARYRARIVLLHVIQTLPSNVRGMLDRVAGEGTIEQLRESRRREAKEVLIGKQKDALRVRRALGGFYGSADAPPDPAFEETEIVIREGVAGDEILRCAEEFKCDLIVLGSSSGPEPGVIDIGGLTKDLLRRSPVPILIAPPAAKE